jgi:hypothetical protein
MVGLQDDDHENDRGQTYNDIEAGPSSSTERSSSPRDEHDYTENASAADIAQAIEQQRMEGEEVIGQNMEGGGPDSGEQLQDYSGKEAIANGSFTIRSDVLYRDHRFGCHLVRRSRILGSLLDHLDALHESSPSTQYG